MATSHATITLMRFLFFSLPFLCTILLSKLQAGDLDAANLQTHLANVVKAFDGRIGACIQAGERTACVRGEESFSLQSVMKLLVGTAVLDAVDKGRRRLDDEATIRAQDLSLNVQPLAQLVGSSGYRTTIGDLVRRAIIDSDSAATDFLIAQLGGPSAVQAVLKAKGISGIRIDRDERHLQTEIAGLMWQPEYVDATVLNRALEAVPETRRQEAYRKYQVDSRDTATPKGMASFLIRLARGDLLSSSSTEYVLKAMDECKTFPNRLKAGVAPGWKIAHKTGTSGSWKGLTVATNDVGILTSPDASQVSIAVFVADSRASSADRAAIIAKICAAAIAHYR
jgi:beta-lactamase class A